MKIRIVEPSDGLDGGGETSVYVFVTTGDDRADPEEGYEAYPIQIEYWEGEYYDTKRTMCFSQAEVTGLIDAMHRALIDVRNRE